MNDLLMPIPKGNLIGILVLMVGISLFSGTFVAAFLIYPLGLPCSSTICIPILSLLFILGSVLFFMGFGILQFFVLCGWLKARKERKGGNTHSLLLITEILDQDC